MRSWACVAWVCVVVGVVVAQNTRLGLLSQQLGVPAVPGAFPGGFPGFNTGFPSANLVQPPAAATQCSCLPSHQQCPFATGASPAATGIRIVNRQDTGACPQGQKPCCPPGVRPPTNQQIQRPPAQPGINSFQPGINNFQPGINNFQPGINNFQPGINSFQPGFPGAATQRGTCGAQNPLLPQRRVFNEAILGEFPWMAVVLDLGDGYKGGGALIAPDWVLTAAHKVQGQGSLKVRLGDQNVRTPQDLANYQHLEVAVDRVVIHPRYNQASLHYDVALLHLANPVPLFNYPHIGAACLPVQGQKFDGQRCWVTGWGRNAFEQSGSFQENLKRVDVPVVDHFVCQERLRRTRLGSTFNLDQTSFLCAGGEAGKDACSGDGGSPLVCESHEGFTVVGLVAWGVGCAEYDIPGVYVNVPNMVGFIRQYVR